jgi:hypothetical protein
MNLMQTSVPVREKHPGKVIYFATGTLAEVSADFSRLRLSGNGTRLRVVAPAEFSARLVQTSQVKPGEVLAYRPSTGLLVWIRLLGFLRFSGDAEILCLTSPRRFRFLKFLALTLRGRVVFSPINGARVPLGFLDLTRIWLRQRRDAGEDQRKNLPVGVVGSASGYYLEKIVPAVRRRYPEAPVHGILLPSATPSTVSLFDSVRVLEPGLVGTLGETLRLIRVRNRYQRWVLPCTDEPYQSLKFLAFFWPLSRRQIYNELSDGFAARDLRTLWRHLQWRLRDRMSFQIVDGTASRSLPMRCVHLGLYVLRLAASVPLLGLARLRARRYRLPLRGLKEAAGARRAEGAWDGKPKAVGERLAHSNVVAPRLPGEPDGPVGLK